jgi:hypothetical protein
MKVQGPPDTPPCVTRLCLGCLVVLAACSPPPPPPPACGGVQADPANPAFGVAGRPLLLRYRLPEPCMRPKSLEATALDPSGEKVELVSTLEGELATVTFTPPVPGLVHLAVRFDSRATARTDVMVAANRSADPGLDVPVGELGLYGVQIDGSGWVIDPFAHLVFTRGADGGRQIIQELPMSPDVVLAGATLWVRDSPRVHRLERGTLPDGGEGYVPRPQEPFRFEAGIILPTGRDVVLVGATVHFGELQPDAGLELRELFPSGGAASVRGRVGGELITDLPGLHGGDCSLSLTDGGETCRNMTSTGAFMYRGGDLEGYWVTDLVVPSLIFRGPRFSQSAPLRVPFDVEWLNGHDGRGPPRFSAGGEVFVARQVDGRVGLDWWGAEVVAVTETAVVTRGDAGTVVHRR